MGTEWMSDERRELLRELRRRRGMGDGDGRVRPRTAPEEPVPLSPGQRRLWVLERLRPGSALYNVSGGARLRGPLDTAALRAALTGIVGRHEVLRSVFSQRADGEPVQRVLPPEAVDLPVSDVDGDPLPAARELAAEPFDLEHGPVVRFHLLRVAEDDHALVVCLHHIVSDGWSLEILIAELVAAYEARTASAAPSLDIQYADYAVWQNERGDTPEVARQLDHWRDRLAGAPLTEIPTDRPRPAAPDFSGGSIVFTVPGRSAIDRIVGRGGTTPFAVGLSAFAVVLSRWSRQEDLVVGVPVAGRQRPEAAPLIGFFVNTLPVRVDLSGDPTFGDLVRRIHDTMLDAHSNAEAPFERIVEAARTERDPGGRPSLVRHLFQVDESPRPLLTARGVDFELFALDTGTAKFDLEVNLEPLEGGGWEARVEYSTELYDAETARSLADSLRRVLTHASPDLPVSRLGLLGADECSGLLEGFGGSPEPVPGTGSATLHGLFEERVALDPGAVAVQYRDTVLTYAELDRRANRLARLLREEGVGPDTVVGVGLPRGPHLLTGLLAVLKAGGAYLPLDTQYPAERLRMMLEDTRARVVVADADALAPEVAEALSGTRLVCPDRDADEIAAQSAEPLDVRVDDRSLAYVIHTSGSTGRPKGAMNEHRAVVNRLLWMQRRYGLEPGEGVLQKTPIGFDVSVWELFWPLITGARCVLARPGEHADPVRLAALVETADVTTIHFVPSMLAAFLTAPSLDGCRRLRRLVCSGEELPARLVDEAGRRLPGVPVHNLYGPTEAAIDVTWFDCREGYGHRVPIGRPVDGCTIRVVDEHLEPVPVGAPGELLIGGVQVCRGYWDRPGLTAERFVPDPFGADGGRLYRTGDLARWRPDGTVEYLGRMDGQVKLRGMRVELGEVETALTDLEGVESAVADVRASGSAGPRLVAYVRPRRDDGWDENPEELAARLREALGRRLPRHMVPVAFALVDAWPLSPNGKLDRRRLPDPVASARRREHVAPATPAERDVARLWTEILGADRVGVSDDFFELGGNSLLAVKLAHRIRVDLRAELPMERLFAAPTVGAMAAQVQSAGHRAEVRGPVLRRVDRSRYRAGAAHTRTVRDNGGTR
ncbi:non-ribosomal peptide synthetase [Nocardiopsis sp. FIRDI 009]|uniref:non-ribosomal peptide synthetase n=1 Tax=Nocardiopsis sp. FIRDI 009 TaxID=714197 RepID=UPI000E21C878|nr:non-ribosomal peptide synthetase [Nocardiopsis sp. FIRDI 009]